MYISILYFNFKNFALRKFIKKNRKKKIFFVLCYVGPSVQMRTHIKNISQKLVGLKLLLFYFEKESGT